MNRIDFIACKNEITQGINQAKKNNEQILISIVRKINKIDPVHFFASGKNNVEGERFFWRAASCEDYLVGLGVTKKIATNKSDEQYSFITEEWKNINESKLIFNEYDTPGVGPIVFGGFSFDPLKTKTILWENFADSYFYIPQYLLTVINGENYITINILCNPDDDLSLAGQIEKVINEIVFNENAETSFPIPKIIKEMEINPEEWKESVTRAEQDLQTAKTLKKIVLARELRLYFEEKVVIENTINHLLKEQPDSYVFALESNGDCFVGATPERLIKKEGSDILTTCLAGSIARGSTKEEDEILGQTLLNDNKNLIEHQYVVDMITEAMEENCLDVSVPNKPVLLKVRDIQHLFTPVTAKSRDGVSIFKIVEALHPTPAIGGLPKVEGVEKIREIEELDRGLYAGPIGWLDYRENGEFAVALRSGLVQGNEASLFAGCGVVVNSKADSEYEETNIKFKPMLTALGRQK